MGVIWYKIWFDLWNNKTRTLLAVLSITAGVFAVGTMFGMSDLLITNLDVSHRSVIAPHIDMYLTEPVDGETLLSLAKIPGVEDVEPYNSVSLQYKLHPQDAWRQGVIHMRGDFEHQKYELVQLREGRWPEKNDVGVERMAAQFLGLGVGDKVIFKIGETERILPISGLIRHPFVPPPQFMDVAFFFMDGQGLERLGISDGTFANLYVRVTPYSDYHAKEVATALKDQLAKQDIQVAAFQYQDPDKHWGRAFFDGITLVLQVLALVSVVMSAVLVYNTLSNLITQQTNQIGILKAIGGRTGTIITVYLASAFIYGALALVVALPLGAVVAFYMTKVFLNLFNIDYNQFEISRQAIGFQIASALVVPLLAGLAPTLQGAGLSVRQAIASYGLGWGRFGSSQLDRAIETIGQRWLPSQYATALGNMFRRKGRLILTQLVLITAGSAFLMVMSLTASLSFTLDNIFARQHYDTLIQFESNQRADRAVSLADSVEGVDFAEMHVIQSASLFVAGQLVKEAGISTSLEGIPSGSDLFRPVLVAGRWLLPGDGRVVVLTRETAEKNHIGIGDLVTLDMGVLGKENWRVVGLYEPIFAGAFYAERIYAPLETVFAVTKKHNQGTFLYVRATSHTTEFVTSLTARLKELYDSRNMDVGASQTQPDARKTDEFQFSTTTSMLMDLSVVVASVGGIALMGALSISVVERTKEIGVLRAVGARSRTILSIFVMEGLLQGVLSWLIAVPVSLLFSQPLANAMGQAMFSATLDYQYDWPAVAIWLGIILVIATLASIMPARSATRISVRDSLTYA